MTDDVGDNTIVYYTPVGKLPDHLLIEIFVRVLYQSELKYLVLKGSGLRCFGENACGKLLLGEPILFLTKLKDASIFL
jgi:hypothetical protein